MSKAYPKYKPSGVEWLGDVPEHWEVKRAGLAYKIQLGKMLQPDTSRPEDEQFAYLKALHVQWEKIQTDDLPVMWASKYELAKYSVKRGDLLVCEGGEVGRAGILRDDLENVIIQNSLHRVRSNNNLNTFLMYVLENAASKHWFEILCNKATIAHFTGDKFSALRIPLPPLPEQQAIAAFLDHETGRIDALIAKKERLLELLAEQRTALISRAVTKGLDASVKLKPSGVEWLGDVPEHWGVKKLKHLTKKIIDNRGRTPEFGDEGIPMLEVKQITEGKRFPTNSFEKFVEESIVKQYERERVLEGDILISTVGATSGKAVIVDKNPSYFIAQNVIGVRPIPEVNNVFFYYSIASDYFVNSLLSINKSNTIDNLKVSIFINNYCLFPPLPEQQAIAAFLDRETSKIDALSSKVVSVIEWLKEYRTALISSAVTGKIDVREAV